MNKTMQLENTLGVLNGLDPLPPKQYISEKSSSRSFQIYPTYPYLRDTQWTQMRQHWHRPLKTPVFLCGHTTFRT